MYPHLSDIIGYHRDFRMAISSIAWSWIFLIPLIPSVVVAIFTLYHLIINRTLRYALNNHVIILLLSLGLIVSLTDVVWLIYYFRVGIVLSSTPAFCLTWLMVDTAIYVSIQVLMAWASIERHILIFYPSCFATRNKRLLFHYLPLIVCVAYPTLFYSVVFIILPCNRPFYYRAPLCARYSCLSRYSWLALWDSICHFMLPAFIIGIFGIGLVVRVLYSRYRIRQRIDWRKYRKLTIQLLPISILYIVLKCPPMIMFAVYTAGVDLGVGGSYFSAGVFFSYWSILLTPFATVLSLPNLRTKCKRLIFFWRGRNMVGPQVFRIIRTNLVPGTPVGGSDR